MKRRLSEIKKLVSPTCEDVVRSLSRHQEEPLPIVRQFFMRVHLVLCGFCRRYKVHLRFIRRAMGEYGGRLHELLRHRLSEQVRMRIKRRIEEEQRRLE